MHAEPDVYAENAAARSSACCGQQWIVAPRARYVVRRTVHRDVDRRQWIGSVTPASRSPSPTVTGARQVSEGVLPSTALGSQERQGQLDHLVVVARPQRLHVRGHTERTEARDVIGMHQLQVGDVVAADVASRSRASKASSVSRTPRSPMACTCTWKPSASSAATYPRNAVASTKEWPVLWSGGRSCRSRATTWPPCRSRRCRPA